MTLDETLKKIREKHHLIGKTLKDGGLRVEVLMPAPKVEKLKTKFIMIAKQGQLDYPEIAELLGVNDFDVIILYEGSVTNKEGYESGTIFTEWLSNFPEIY